jgi:hypothetical protein
VRGNGFANLSSRGLLDNTSGGVGGGFCVFQGGLNLAEGLLSGNTATGNANTNGGTWNVAGGAYATPDSTILDAIDSY